MPDNPGFDGIFDPLTGLTPIDKRGPTFWMETSRG